MPEYNILKTKGIFGEKEVLVKVLTVEYYVVVKNPGIDEIRITNGRLRLKAENLSLQPESLPLQIYHLL